MASHPIEKKIAEREAQCKQIQLEITELRSKEARLAAEIVAYKDALQYVSGSNARARRGGRAKKRTISDQWTTYLKLASNNGSSTFAVDDILTAAQLQGADLKRPSVRTQAANLVIRGTLERVRDGVFRLTANGAKELGVELSPDENGEAGASPETDQSSSSDLTPNPARESTFD